MNISQMPKSVFVTLRASYSLNKALARLSFESQSIWAALQHSGQRQGQTIP